MHTKSKAGLSVGSIDRVSRRVSQSFFPPLFNPSMGTQAYPGKGLSVSQLAFALNEELKHAVHSPSYVTKDHRRKGWHAYSL